MELLLHLPEGAPIQASDAYLIRALGEPVRWRFVISLGPESWGDRESALVQRVCALLAKPCKVSAEWRGIEAAKLGPDATVVSVSRSEEAGKDGGTRTHMVEIEANGTSVEPQPDPFVSRRRVHKVKDLKQLLARLGHVVKPLGALQTDLERVRLPDAGKACVIQDGVSDWRFLFHVFDQCQWLVGATANWIPLTLVGSVDEEKGFSGKWLVTPGAKRAYEGWGTVSPRTLRYTAEDGMEQMRFGTTSLALRSPTFPSGEIPSVVTRHPERVFEPGRWKKWRTMDLPCFADNGMMVWRIEDRLHASATTLHWESNAYAAPAEASFVGPENVGRLRPWTGMGTVEAGARDGPWVTVRLPGFEKGDDLVNVRVATPYSGKDGRRGLHMVPEKGTEVLLTWSGRFDESVVLVANIRSEAAEYPSPSTYLEDEHTAQYAHVHVVKIDSATVDSKLALSVGESTEVNSSEQLQVNADGAVLKMSDGSVYTGA